MGRFWELGKAYRGGGGVAERKREGWGELLAGNGTFHVEKGEKRGYSGSSASWGKAGGESEGFYVRLCYGALAVISKGHPA